MTKNGKFKFNLVETFTNKEGSISSSEFIAVISAIVSLLIIAAAAVFYFIEPTMAGVIQIFDKAIIVLGISAGLFGVRKFTSTLASKKTESENYNSSESNPNADLNNMLCD